MQFIITAYDGKDEGAPQRRMAVREQHLALAASMAKEKKTLYGAALLDENEKMIGSVLIFDFPSRQELDEYLKVEPYVTGNVWQNIDIKTCKVAATFMELHK
jgi:uncharacterized protein